MMTNKENGWMERVRTIAPVLEAEADQHDREGSFVARSYDALRQQRFFSMAVPPALGGGGASYPELCETVRELARHCGSTALAFSMHSHLVAASVWRHLHGQPAEKLLRKVADEEAVLLSTGASDWIDSNGTMERVDGGFLLSARKIFGSGGPAASMLIASAPYQDPKEGPQVLHFPVPTSAEGVSFASDWDSLGMRGTGSNTVILDRVFIPDETIVLRRPRGQWHPVWSVVMTVAPPIYMAPYVGLAEAAASKARELAAESTDEPRVVLQAGELENALAATRIVWQSMVENAVNYDFAPEL
jgi:alkylation response protein AidB-like acyl-CoA dehydrogenase